MVEDFTSETFVAGVKAARDRTVSELMTAWLVGVTKHKLEPAPRNE